MEKTLLALVFITLGGTDTERTWLEIQSLWQKATGTALPPEWKDGLLEHIPPALPPVGTPPTPGGTMPEPGVETYPSEEKPFGSNPLTHPDLPEGQGTGIHDQTPPVVDIPQVLEARVLQKGGHTVSKATANALNEEFNLNLPSREWGRAIEKLKHELLLDPDDHGTIYDDGIYESEDGSVSGSFLEYAKKAKPGYRKH